MCTMLRQPVTEGEPGHAAPAPGLDHVRPRWMGAGAAMLVGGLAVAAALVTPTLNAPEATLKASGAPATVSARAGIVPAAAVVEQTSLPADDGVPSATDVVKAGAGNCSHGM